MKNFLEMKEILTDEDELNGIQSVFIRVEVNGRADAISKKSRFTSEFVGKSHRDTHHICNHPGQSCSSEDITEE